MLVLESAFAVKGLTAREVFDFMVDCDDDRYRAWWPGTHLRFHVLVRSTEDDHVGDLVWMDEFVGRRHLRMAATVCEVESGRKIVWQLRPRGLRLPVRLALSLADGDGGLLLRHTLTAGWSGWARVFDPLWRLYFSPAFADALDDHCRTEFHRLPDALHPPGPHL